MVQQITTDWKAMYEVLQECNADLEQRCKELEADLSDANHDIDTASESVKVLMEANDKLEAENAELRRRLQTGGLDN